MFYLSRLFFVILFAILPFVGDAKEKNSLKFKKKYNLSICAIFGEETKFLREWIEYHQLVGVDHFYLYNNQPNNGAKEVLKSFIKSGVVSLIPWDQMGSFKDSVNGFSWALSAQIPAYENAIYIKSGAETKWLICLDVNEYLVPLKSDKVSNILDGYSECAGLLLFTDCFDSSVKTRRPGTRLLIENIDLVASPKGNLNQEVVKTIFKPELCKGFIWPPYRCKFKEDREAIKIPRSDLRINRYVYQERLCLENLKRKLYVNNQALLEGEVAELLEEGYEIEDQERAIDRFLPQLRKKMGLDKEWE